MYQVLIKSVGRQHGGIFINFKNANIMCYNHSIQDNFKKLVLGMVY